MWEYSKQTVGSRSRSAYTLTSTHHTAKHTTLLIKQFTNFILFLLNFSLSIDSSFIKFNKTNNVFASRLLLRLRFSCSTLNLYVNTFSADMIRILNKLLIIIIVWLHQEKPDQNKTYLIETANGKLNNSELNKLPKLLYCLNHTTAIVTIRKTK